MCRLSDPVHSEAPEADASPAGLASFFNVNFAIFHGRKGRDLGREGRDQLCMRKGQPRTDEKRTQNFDELRALRIRFEKLVESSFHLAETAGSHK